MTTQVRISHLSIGYDRPVVVTVTNAKGEPKAAEVHSLLPPAQVVGETGTFVDLYVYDDQCIAVTEGERLAPGAPR